jgi:hypothetical protein
MIDGIPASSSPRARKRPGVVLFYFAYRALVAAALALPLAYAVGVVMGDQPEGDARLFEPTGMVLLDVLTNLEATRPALTMQAALVMACAAIVGLGPLLILMVALAADPGVGLRRVLRRAVTLLGTLSLLYGLAAAATVALVGLTVGFTDMVLGRVAWSGPENRDVAHAGALALGAVVALLFGVFHDIARAIAVRRGFALYDTISCTLRLAKKRGLTTLATYFARAFPAALVVVGTLLATANTPRVSSLSVALTLLAGQAALLVAVALRASWLAAAMRLCDRFIDDEARAWEEEQRLAAPALLTSGDARDAPP